MMREDEIDFDGLRAEMNEDPRQVFFQDLDENFDPDLFSLTDEGEAQADAELARQMAAFTGRVAEFWFDQNKQNVVKVVQMKRQLNARTAHAQRVGHKQGFMDGLFFAAVCALVAVSFALLIVCSHPK